MFSYSSLELVLISFHMHDEAKNEHGWELFQFSGNRNESVKPFFSKPLSEASLYLWLNAQVVLLLYGRVPFLRVSPTRVLASPPG